MTVSIAGLTPALSSAGATPPAGQPALAHVSAGVSAIGGGGGGFNPSPRLRFQV
jgi:hypothetical protein